MRLGCSQPLTIATLSGSPPRCIYFIHPFVINLNSTIRCYPESSNIYGWGSIWRLDWSKGKAPQYLQELKRFGYDVHKGQLQGNCKLAAFLLDEISDRTLRSISESHITRL